MVTQSFGDDLAISAGASQAARFGMFELGIVENDDVYSMLGEAPCVEPHRSGAVVRRVTPLTPFGACRNAQLAASAGFHGIR